MHLERSCTARESSLDPHDLHETINLEKWNELPNIIITFPVTGSLLYIMSYYYLYSN